ncbi:hypothetical protein ATANTOWER_002235 [Ataeniobius toweri]|uniref:Uncharacterized protein n=1 Tax=Ataeniobius toweri TaxID=208326 RepID=A0ABU7CEK1_9TELE|nr:hypothetical protein [Ataeniobius toweri]
MHTILAAQMKVTAAAGSLAEASLSYLWSRTGDRVDVHERPTLTNEVRFSEGKTKQSEVGISRQPPSSA